MIRLNYRHFSKYSSTLLHVLSLIKTEIKSQAKCSHVLQISDMYQVTPDINSLSVSETNLIVHPPSDLHSNNASTKVFYHRFSGACSVIFLDIEQIRNEVNNIKPISPYGSSNPAFKIYIQTHRGRYFQVNFAVMTKKIPCAFLLVQTDTDLFNLYQSQANHQTLKLISTLKSHSIGTNAILSTQSSLNYLGAVLNVTTCVNCVEGFEMYEMTGKWLTWSEAILWDLSVRLNATINFLPVSSAPRLEPENGTWDDWVTPLIEGTGSIASFQPYSRTRLEAFYYADPIDFDHVSFITRKPQRVYIGGFSRLLYPFSLLVWIGSCCSILFLFIAIEVLIYFHHTVSNPHQCSVALDSPKIAVARETPSYHWMTFNILVAPMIGQSSSNGLFDDKISTDPKAKFLLAVWLLISIVLVSAYQSEMTSFIVMPEYSKPPVNFPELVNSKFGLNAVLWGGNIEADFESANVSFGRKLITSVKEFEYSEPDCYIKIFEGDNACIGFHGTFFELAVMFVVDIRGQILFLESKEHVFPRTLTYAISRDNFDLKEPLDYIIRSTLASGVTKLWTQNLYALLKKTGIQHAHEIKGRLQIYGGSEEDRTDSIVPLLIRIGILGFTIATCMFIFENLSRASQGLGKYCFKPESNTIP